MKRYGLKILSMFLLLALLAALPMTAFAASNKPKIKTSSASVSVTNDGVKLKIKWSKVSKASGYQYAYNLSWNSKSTSKDYTYKTTTGTSATLQLKNYGTIDFRVRAFRIVKGKRVYGKWSRARLKRSKVDDMVVKKLKKRMKTKKLFMRAQSKTAVRTNAGESYGVVAQLSRTDEVRATGKFKRDSKGTWWTQVYASIDQNTTVKGWVSRKTTEPVWY